ncbi:XRE family transcriptional regulator [Aphanothece hegewaldii CCALA 016]|uniref:XRE family transcriptional regulator n=1 Tax=Aphanothece hegewaldii CCALA 016 TaxID=2107694 RepID=A0A2T1LT93_9CHRO|nr:helix-turn-helix transcriptional regulator [Aphanothece hegewaldii]PSF33640.1 XRE family transcriptional regulator [Aphanothece hegewaldii CCALA 016]
MNERLIQDEKPLKVLIEQAGYTQKDFASRMGMAYSAIKYYVAGQRMPSASVLADMCRVLNKSPKTVMKALGIDITGIPDDE